MRLASLSLVSLFALANPLHAQAVEVIVRESATHGLVPGAIVRLLKESRAVSQGLTNERGRVVLSGSGPGTYRLRVDRIGWTGLLTDPFELRAGETLEREVAMESRVISLPTLTVTGKSTCGFDEAAPVTALLWEEIRKALTANVLTQRQGRLPVHVTEFSRELAPSGATVREWVTGSSLVRGPPFGSLPPALLAQAGFVQVSGDSMTYAAPDASTLLSDEFVGTHCFRTVPVMNGLVGLEFTPARGRRVTDVRGTLWVDRIDNQLKYLEYSYTGLDSDLPGEGLGGRVEFTRLPTGAWIVSYWHTRMPRLALGAPASQGNRHPEAVLLGYLERGGRAGLAAGATGIVDRAILIGRVFDSTSGRGLAGAMVRLEGYADSVVTDEDGRFELDARISGVQSLGVAHPKLGALREPAGREVLLSIGDTTRVSLGVPSMATIVRMLCGSARGHAGLVGIVYRPDGTPAADADVRIQWLTSGGRREERDRTGSRGLFAICDVSAGPTLPVRVLDGQRVLLEERVRLEPREFRWLDLRLLPERQ